MTTRQELEGKLRSANAKSESVQRALGLALLNGEATGGVRAALTQSLSTAADLEAMLLVFDHWQSVTAPPEFVRPTVDKVPFEQFRAERDRFTADYYAGLRTERDKLQRRGQELFAFSKRCGGIAESEVVELFRDLHGTPELAVLVSGRA